MLNNRLRHGVHGHTVCTEQGENLLSGDLKSQRRHRYPRETSRDGHFLYLGLISRDHVQRPFERKRVFEQRNQLRVNGAADMELLQPLELIYQDRHGFSAREGRLVRRAERNTASMAANAVSAVMAWSSFSR